MTLIEIKKLVNTLRALGIRHYKCDGIELEIGPEPKRSPKKSQVSATPPDAAEIPHIVEEMKSVMKLSDVDLLDRLFPDTEKKDEESDVVQS